MKKICIIDYGLGNLASMFNAVRSLNYNVIISKDIDKIKNSSHIILPGVGSFQSGMNGLKQNNLIEILSSQVLDKKKRFLGVCLGMQLLFSSGTEDGENQGLNWINGKVVKINVKSKNFKIPHMGWNEVDFSEEKKLFKGIKNLSSFYFVHSYHVIPEDDLIVSGTFSYGSKIVASIERENIFATQFHPEKSHNVGSQVLKNFIE